MLDPSRWARASCQSALLGHAGRLPPRGRPRKERENGSDPLALWCNRNVRVRGRDTQALVDRIDIVYVFGAGSVQGAWEPGSPRRREDVHQPSRARRRELVVRASKAAFTHLNRVVGRLRDEELEAAPFGKGDHNETRRRMARQERARVAPRCAISRTRCRRSCAPRTRGRESRVREEIVGEDRRRLLAMEGQRSSPPTGDLCLDKWLEGADEPVKNRPPARRHFRTHKAALARGGQRNSSEPPRATCASPTLLARDDHFGFARRVYVVGLSLLSRLTPHGRGSGDGLKSAQQPGENRCRKSQVRDGRIVRQIRMLAPEAWRIWEMPVS